LAHGEIENVGATTLCIPLFESATLDAVNLTMVINGPAYSLSGSSVSEVCLVPGARANLSRNQGDVPSSLLTDANTFSYAISALALTTQEPSTGSPVLLSTDRMQGAVSFEVDGQLRSGVVSIYKTSRSIFFAKDTHGLLVDDTSAFPSMLARFRPTSARLQELPFRVFHEPTRWDRRNFPKFIVGTAAVETGRARRFRPLSTRVCKLREPSRRIRRAEGKRSRRLEISMKRTGYAFAGLG